MGAAGRDWMLREWALPALVERLRRLLAGSLAAAVRSPRTPTGCCAVRPAG